MSAPDEKGYTIMTKGGILVFRTGRFAEARSSVLHSGIYSRELASMLSAGIVLAIPALLFLAGKPGNSVALTLLRALFLLAVFVGLFLLFRTVIFRERLLVATFDRLQGGAEILIPGFVVKKKTGSVWGTYGMFLSRRSGRKWRTPMPLNLCRGYLPSMGR